MSQVKKIFLNLTLTNVVFESNYPLPIHLIPGNLTLTNVVFE